MAVGVSGYLPSFYQTNAYIPKYGGMYIAPHYIEEYYAEGNYSIIKIDHINFQSSMYSQSVTWSVSGFINIDGIDYWYGGSLQTGGHTATSWACSIVSNPIYHNDADGRKTITISLTTAYTSSGQVGAQWSDTGTLTSAAVALTTIPRLSEISASNGTLGVAQTLSVTQKSASYTHTIVWSCGSASGTICTKSSALSFEWTPSIDLASQNTTGASVSVAFTITTYIGDTSIGSKTLTVIYAIPESVKPSVTMTITDANGYADKYGGYVQSRSKFKVVLGVVTAYGSEIAVNAVSIEGTTYYGESIESAIINGSGAVSVKATVTDKRGRIGTATVDVDVLPYTQPAILGVTYNRADADGTDNVMGEYAEVVMNASVTALGGNNSATYRLQYKKLSDSTYTDFDMTEYQNVYSLEDVVAIFAAAADYSYNIVFTVSDDFSEKFGFAKTEFVLQTGKVLMHRRAKGNGMGLGRICEEDDLLDIDWNIRGRKNLDIDGALTVGGKSIADFIDPLKFMPVGYIYVSSNPTSPAELFGGTWEQLKDRVIVGAGGSYAVDSTGGEATHTLTISEMPSHKHIYTLSGGSLTGGTGHADWSQGAHQEWSTQATGGSAAHNNMQPYIAKYIWERVE